MTTTLAADPVIPLRPHVGALRRAPRPGLLAAAVVAGSAAVLALWWAGTSATAASTPGDAATALGELVGMLASFLVCVQLLLVARVPWAERAAGQDRLTAWHRTLGTTVVLLVAAHVVAMVAGGALLDRATPWDELVQLLERTPYLLWALIGTVTFLAAGLSSARLVRRRLSYEWWYVIHLTVYGGIFLAFFHQVQAGTHFVDSTAARAAWWVLYAGTALAVAWHRVLAPTVRHLRLRPRVAAVVPAGRDTVGVWVTGPGLGSLGARPGQFFLVRFLAAGHWFTAHPYSVSAVPRDDTLRFTVGALGDHSSTVPLLPVGTPVLLEGPFGTVTADRAHRAVLLVAGGAGIGPVRALAEELVARGTDTVVLHRAHDEAGLAHRDEFPATPTLRYVPMPGRRADLGYDPLSPSVIAHLVPDVRDRDVILCGPPGMVEDVSVSLRLLGVPAAAVHHEEMSWS